MVFSTDASDLAGAASTFAGVEVADEAAGAAAGVAGVAGADVAAAAAFALESFLIALARFALARARSFFFVRSVSSSFDKPFGAWD